MSRLNLVEAEFSRVSYDIRNVPHGGSQEIPFPLKLWKNSPLRSKPKGVLEPLLVRELEERNDQVVIGARRLLRAKIAELEAVPVRVAKLPMPRPSKVGKIFLC
jgi:hypothetical protein